MRRMLSRLSVYKVATLCLVVTLLLTGWAAASLEPEKPELGEPPVWPERLAVTAVSQEWDYFIYLPLVQRPPPPPPWVDTQNREAARTLYLEEYLGSASSDSGWTGNHASCGAGVTSETFRAAILRRINYFRSMAGIPPLTGFNDTYNQKAQSAALMMSVNRTLSHSPDASWICYTEEGEKERKLQPFSGTLWPGRHQ